MNKYLDEKWENSLVPYDDKEYALKQLEQLRGDLSSVLNHMSKAAADLYDGVDRVTCGLTRGHTWRLIDFDRSTYPMRTPPGVYEYECIYCGETIVLQADKKEDWEPFLKLEVVAKAKVSVMKEGA